MRHHFHRKVAYKEYGGRWVGLSGSQILYLASTAAEPPPEAVFLLYVEPGDDERFFHCDLNGMGLTRGGRLHPGWSVRTGSPGVGSMPISYGTYPGFPDLVTLVDAEGFVGWNLQQGPTRWLWMHPDRGAPFECKLMTPEWDSPQSWAGADLTNVDFRGMGAVLPSVRDWNGADMSRAVFDGLDLRQVRFSGAVRFTDASLVGVNWSGRDLGVANLDGADLTGANLSGARLADASMAGTNFSGADLTGARFGRAPRFSRDVRARTDLRGARLNGAELSDVAYTDLRGTALTMAAGSPFDARHADLRGVIVSGALLRGGTLDDALLADTDLTGADVVGTSFDRCDLTSTRLPATLDDCGFVGADLSGLALSETSMRRADLTGAALVDTSLEEADVTGARFDDGDLTGAVLLKTNLTGASLRGATLRKASLALARLVDADCSQAQMGATTRLFTLPAARRAALAEGRPSDELVEAFAAHGVPLARSAGVTASAPHGGWLLADGEQVYRIAADADGGDLAVHAYLSTDQAAVLTGAYMTNAIFDQAEMFAVNMSGAHWYGGRARALGANLEQIDASGANLGQINLVQAKLMGAGLTRAVLVRADLTGALLGPSKDGRPSSLASAHLAGADLTAADLHLVAMTNAAVAVEASAGGVAVAGVPLLVLDARFAATLDDEQISAALRETFAVSGYGLADDAEAATLRAGAAWQISHGHDDPEQAQNRYAQLQILRRDDGLHVHGSALWITRIGDDGLLETIRFGYPPTILSTSDMSDQTMCPNGKMLRTNVAERRPWHAMMTAAGLPPVPPECIPDPDSWDCPAPDGVRAGQAAAVR